MKKRKLIALAASLMLITAVFTAGAASAADIDTKQVTVSTLQPVTMGQSTSMTGVLKPSGRATWTSDNPAVATVSNDGMVTGVTRGTAVIRAGNASCRVAVVPELTVLPDDPARPITKDNSVQMLWQGFLEEKITVDGVVRTAKAYVPAGTNQGTRFVLMNVPQGYDTAAFLVASGWMDLADQYQFCLYALEPKDGVWGAPEQELPYILAGYAAERAGVYNMPFSSNYVVGYGAVGANLQKAVMANPLSTAAAVYLDASSVDAAYLAQMKEKTFEGFGVDYAQVPVPTWIISPELTGQTAEMVSYWKTANDCTDKAGDFHGGAVYLQDPMSTNVFTPRQKVGRVAVLQAAADPMDTTLTRQMYEDFFAPVSRYGGGARGNMLVSRVDYDSLGVEYGSFTCDGYKREYLVYVPKSARASGESLPVVYAFHGAQTTMQMFFENTLWYEVAEERNFILVVPESDLNPMNPGALSAVAKAARPSWALTNALTADEVNNVAFVQQLIQEIDSKYNTDPSRRYATGHSNGCMFTNYLGTQISDSFTALGAISGPLLSQSYIDGAVATGPIPFFMTMGEFDMWNWNIFNQNPDGDENIRNTVTYWMNRNQVTTDLDHGLTYNNGRYHNYVWFNQDGIPMVRYTMVALKGHLNIPDEMWTLWDEWFALWTRAEDGTRLYMGATAIP